MGPDCLRTAEELEPGWSRCPLGVRSLQGSRPFPVETRSSFPSPAPHPPLANHLGRHTQCPSCDIFCTMAARSCRTTTTNLMQTSPPIPHTPAKPAASLRARMPRLTLPPFSSSSLISWPLGRRPWPWVAAQKSFPSSRPMIPLRSGYQTRSPRSHPLTRKLSPSRNLSRKINSRDSTL